MSVLDNRTQKKSMIELKIIAGLKDSANWSKGDPSVNFNFVIEPKVVSSRSS